jgi:hypothetical protein
MSESFFAIRQTNFSDSITHGPRMNAGRFPPMVAFPTRSGFGSRINALRKAGTQQF